MSARTDFARWEDAVSWLREQPDTAQLVAECYYDDPLLNAARRYADSEEWSAVGAILAGRSGRALDVGAGRGIASYALACAGFAVTALEPNPSNLVGAGAIRCLAAESHLPITVVEHVSEQLPFPDRHFDVIFTRATLHHTRCLPQACREFFRVLKSDGLLLAAREHVISTPADLPRFLAQHPLHRLYGGENALLLKEYVNAITEAGFSRLQVLSPWSSPINYGPRTLASLQAEIVSRVSARVPAASRYLRNALSVGAIWRLTRAVLERIDRRPGRLYSFVAQP